MRARACLSTLLVYILWSHPAAAQNWSFDARRIALGGIGGAENVSASMIDEERTYRSIVLPFGLVQVLRDFDKFNPESDRFDPVRAVEYAASPVHYVFGRDTTDSGGSFVTDVRNATLSRDLNAYRGFAPAETALAEGLASPNWGGTIKFRQRGAGSFHGVYIGAGPYLSMRTKARVDPQLIAVLGSDTPVYVPNARFEIADDSEGQMALAVTGGYRARVAWPSGVGSGSPRNGLYIGANYHYLRGFRYEAVDLRLALDTDRAGLLTINPQGPAPLVFDRKSATGGQGFALDLGVAAVLDRWEVGFGANGIANRIDWIDIERTTYALGSLFGGDDFEDTARAVAGEARVELPVDYRGNAAYHGDAWSAVADFGRGFQGTSFHGGLEYRLSRIELRGGGRYANERWHPTGGVGVNLSEGLALDVAAFGTAANIEREQRFALAVSLRLNR